MSRRWVRTSDDPTAGAANSTDSAGSRTASIASRAAAGRGAPRRGPPRACWASDLVSRSGARSSLYTVYIASPNAAAGSLGQARLGDQAQPAHHLVEGDLGRNGSPLDRWRQRCELAADDRLAGRQDADRDVPWIGLGPMLAASVDLADIRLWGSVVEGGDRALSWTHPSPRASTVRLCIERRRARDRATASARWWRVPGVEIGRLSGSEHANVQVGCPMGGLGRERVAGIERAPAPAAGREARDVQGAPVDRDRDASRRRAWRHRPPSTGRAGPVRAARPSVRPAGARHRRDRPARPSPGKEPYPRRSRRASTLRSGSRSVARRGAAASADAGRGRRSRARARSRPAR